MSSSTASLKKYILVLDDFIKAWNRADARAVADFYTDDLDYRDPSVPKGISNKKELIEYLELMFQVWPKQEWIPGDIFPHETPGAFTGCYEFKIANDHTEITGIGMDRLEFEGDKIRLNHVYLNARNWNNWLKRELVPGA